MQGTGQKCKQLIDSNGHVRTSPNLDSQGLINASAMRCVRVNLQIFSNHTQHPSFKNYNGLYYVFHPYSMCSPSLLKIHAEVAPASKHSPAAEANSQHQPGGGHAPYADPGATLTVDNTEAPQSIHRRICQGCIPHATARVVSKR